VSVFRWLSYTLLGRSGKWAAVRKAHLEKESACIACGGDDDLEVHHIVPISQNASRELDPSNLCTLCADPCHLVHGHLMSFRRANPFVREDCRHYRERLEAARKAQE
jgi:5-methylcytosine-specific restriction endonuclease McrA